MLNVIREPDEFCKPCGLYKHCKSPIMNGEGTEHPLILFVGEAPGFTEDETGIPFCGKEGSELRQCIEDVGIPIQKCRFTNAVRCRPPNNDLKKWPKAVEHCRVHLLREIRATRPKVVVLIGNHAMKSALNKTGIMKMHGEVIDSGRVIYVCMFHPGWLVRNDTPGNRRKFTDALRTAKRFALGTTKVAKKFDQMTCMTRKDLYELSDTIKKSHVPATDAEMSMVSPFSTVRPPQLGVIGFSWDSHSAGCVPLQIRTGLSGCKFHWKEGLEAVKEMWEYPGLKWLAHNGKTDMLWGIYHNIWLGGKKHKTGLYVDTMLASYALDHRKGIHGLKDWAFRVGMANYDQPKRQYCILHPEANPEGGKGNLLLVPAEILYDYNMKDCICTRRTFFKQEPELKQRDLWNKPLMFPLMYEHWVALMMELEGVAINRERNSELDQLYARRLAKIDLKLYSFPAVKKLQRIHDDRLLEETIEHVDNYKKAVPNPRKKVLELFESHREIVNLNSPDVKRELLFDVMDYEARVFTKGKKPVASTERWVLEELYAQQKHPILRNIIQRGTYFSMHAKYIKPVPAWIGTDGRTHTLYKLHATDTGRPASENPNHLNLPARSELTDEVMSQFIPGPGKVLVKQDSKQIELRLIADRAQDKVMIQEFNDGKDPHAMGAQAANNYTEAQWAELDKDLQKKLRGEAKNAVSFGLVYGRLAPALALDFGWRLKKAIEFKAKYFAKYHGIWEYLKRMKKLILKYGYVISNYGRIRTLPDYNSDDEAKREAAVREGINSPIQGDASDINFIAAYRMARWLRKHKMKTRVIIFVYDAVYLDAHHSELADCLPQLHSYMTDREYITEKTGWELGVPLDTDCSIGPDLGPGMTELQRIALGEWKIPEALAA